MERVKYVEEPRINEKVAAIMETLKDELVNRFHPRSIILTGSLGRGEATVIEESGKLRFLSDCEIIIIPYWYIFNRNKLKKFELYFREKTGLEIEIWGATLSLYLLLPFMSKQIRPTMNNYDLKYGSRVIYGNDYLRRIPNFEPQDVPLWEGIRLLFNRMAESLQYFSPESPHKDVVFWTDKIVLACQDALLLSVGRYHPSYKVKNQMLLELYPQYFSKIKTPCSFPEMAEQATWRKLYGSKNKVNTIDYWFEVVEACDNIFRYVIQKEMEITFGDYTDFQKKYIVARHSGSAIGGNLLNLGKQLIIYRRFLPPSLIRRASILWVHVVYSLIPLVYFCLTGRDDRNEKYLAHIRSNIPTPGTKKGSRDEPHREWAEVKGHVINLWRQICW